MQIGMIGLGRMGANMARRLLKAGHECIVYDTNADNVAQMVAEGAKGATSSDDLLSQLKPPRAVWLMLPAAITGKIARALAEKMQRGDVLVDGGNSFYRDAVDLGGELSALGIDVIDAGTSGGVWGLERGYCLMIGGPKPSVERLGPIFAALAPGGAPGSAEGVGTAPLGYLHCGATGAGHFVKMVHNGIEYGVMQAYAEGLNLLHAANAGSENRTADAETAPLRDAKYYHFDINLPAVAEVWRHSSVISSWLLDLTAEALKQDHTMTGFAGRVSDSGEGRWTLAAATDVGVPAPVLASALFARFNSQGEADFANRLLSAMRMAFGGHVEKKG